MADSSTYDEATLARRYAMAQKLLAGDKPPVRHWAEGLGNMAEAALGGYQFSKLDNERKAEKEQGKADLYATLGLPAPAAAAAAPEGGFQKLAALLSGSPSPAPVAPGGDQAAYPAPPAAPPAPTTFRPGIAAPDYSKAIAGIESGGAYDKLGPVTKTGDRAFGKYQVMGNNIPEWTAQVLGKPMTAEQFIANPDAQEAVFKAKFGNYVDKYGPEGAAKAWFAGEKGMNNPGAKDVLGTTVSGYGQKFMAGLGPQAPSAAPQVAAALTAPTGDAALPPGATPAQGALPTAEQAAGGSGILANVPADKKRQIATMLSSSNPTVKALGTSMIQQLTKPEVTDEIKEYKLDAEQRKAAGQPPRSFFDFKSELKKAGATNVTTNVDKGEDSFAKAAGSAQAKRFDELAGEGQKAKQMIADIDSLTELGKSIGTGKGAEVLAKIGPWAESIGVPVKGLSEIQAFEAITNRIAPSLRVPGSGAQSDFELKNFLKSVPALGNTPEGNAIASATMKGLQENKIRASEIGSKALNGEITRPQAEKMLRELPDPMEGYRAYVKANPAKGNAAPAAPAKPAVPAAGEIRDGYRFKGGNPADQKNWEQIR
jgi:hypothetical protein